MPTAPAVQTFDPTKSQKNKAPQKPKAQLKNPTPTKTLKAKNTDNQSFGLITKRVKHTDILVVVMG
ncbi:MAG: hypothetical protein U1E91_02140 [Moraxella sp.]